MKTQDQDHPYQNQAINSQEESSSKQQQVERPPNKTGIPDRLKAVVEHFSQVSLNEVRVHYNSDKPAAIGAAAYAEYPNIYIAPGAEKHLAEEVWHIVQQMKGEASATTEFQGGKKGNDDPNLEKKAVKEGTKMEQTTVPKEEATPIPISTTPKPMAQRAVANAASATNEYYQETDMGLARINEEQYNELDEEEATTHEEGFTTFNITNAAELNQWELNGHVLELRRQRGRGQIRKAGNFSLPVSCIESAEHIVHYAQTGNVPNWAEDQNKSVQLSFNNEDGANEEAINISEDEITADSLAGYTSYDFDAGGLEVGEGVLVIRADAPETSLHAVAVVGKNATTGQIIVLERNAGETTGSTDYVDTNWTLNIYGSAAAFRNSMPNGDDYIMGKLANPVANAAVAMDVEEDD
ncbi:MAG: hypothetical protein ACRBFS_16640 [Aureispira sp.]